MLNSLVYVNCCTLNAAVQPNVASHCCMPNTYKGLYSVCVCVCGRGGGGGSEVDYGGGFNQSNVRRTVLVDD